MSRPVFTDSADINLIQFVHRGRHDRLDDLGGWSRQSNYPHSPTIRSIVPLTVSIPQAQLPVYKIYMLLHRVKFLFGGNNSADTHEQCLWSSGLSAYGEFAIVWICTRVSVQLRKISTSSSTPCGCKGTDIRFTSDRVAPPNPMGVNVLSRISYSGMME